MHDNDAQHGTQETNVTWRWAYVWKKELMSNLCRTIRRDGSYKSELKNNNAMNRDEAHHVTTRGLRFYYQKPRIRFTERGLAHIL